MIGRDRHHSIQILDSDLHCLENGEILRSKHDIGFRSLKRCMSELSINVQ